MIIALAFVAAAVAGTMARAELTGRFNGGRLPWATVVVNVSGSAALGLFAGAGPEVATVVGTALLGSYTTFSTFALELVELVRGGRPGAALAYLGLTWIPAVAAAWLTVTLTSGTA